MDLFLVEVIDKRPCETFEGTFHRLIRTTVLETPLGYDHRIGLSKKPKEPLPLSNMVLSSPSASGIDVGNINKIGITIRIPRYDGKIAGIVGAGPEDNVIRMFADRFDQELARRPQIGPGESSGLVGRLVVNLKEHV